MEEMPIGEVAKRAGLRPSALRYYESVHLLPEPRRVGGQRRYGPEVLKRLELIRVAQLAGFTVAEIRQLFHGFPADRAPSERWRELAEQKLAEVEQLIERAEAMRALLEEGIRCRCASFEECALLARRGADGGSC